LEKETFKTGESYDVTARSLLLFELQPDETAAPANQESDLRRKS
jgi:hypothetical protein